VDSCLLEGVGRLRDLVFDLSSFYGASVHRLVLLSALKTVRGL